MAATGNGNTPVQLADRIRRWIVIGGCILGGWALLQNAFMLLAWGPSIYARYFRFGILVPIHRLSVMVWFAAPLLLLIGCWGFHRHRPWARPVLLAYAATWFVGLLGVQSVQFIDILSGQRGDLSFRQILNVAVSHFDLLLYATVFPAFVFLSLRRPEVRDTFPEFRPGFTPITGSDRAS
jgi:hypothetical protein